MTIRIRKLETDLVRVFIEGGFNDAFNTAYKEFTYASGDLTKIEIWDTVAKATKLFTKDLTYTSGDLTGLAIVDELNSTTLTKVFAYTSGDLTSITETIT